MSKNNTFNSILFAGIAAALLSAAMSASATIRPGNDNPNKKSGAATSSQEAKTNKPDNGQAERLLDKSDRLVGNQINSLNRLSDRVQTMKKISQEEKTAILNQIQANIIQLNTLKNSAVASSTATTTPQNGKANAKAQRSYSVIAPRGYIIAAADRINALADKMRGLSAKLASKINQAEAAGSDMAAVKKTLSEMNIKIADAVKQAADAKLLVDSLIADDGDEPKAAQNRAAILAAREKIKTATYGLKSARLDANNIAKEIRKMGIKTNVGLGNTAATNATSSNATSTNATTTNATSTNATSTNATSTNATTTNATTTPATAAGATTTAN